MTLTTIIIADVSGKSGNIVFIACQRQEKIIPTPQAKKNKLTFVKPPQTEKNYVGQKCDEKSYVFVNKRKKSDIKNLCLRRRRKIFFEAPMIAIIIVKKSRKILRTVSHLSVRISLI